MLCRWLHYSFYVLAINAQVLFITGDDGDKLQSLIDNLQALQTQVAVIQVESSYSTMQFRTSTLTKSVRTSLATTSFHFDSLPASTSTTTSIYPTNPIFAPSNLAIAAKNVESTLVSTSTPANNEVFTLVQAANGLFEIAGLERPTSADVWATEIIAIQSTYTTPLEAVPLTTMSISTASESTVTMITFVTLEVTAAPVPPLASGTPVLLVPLATLIPLPGSEVASVLEQLATISLLPVTASFSPTSTLLAQVTTSSSKSRSTSTLTSTIYVTMWLPDSSIATSAIPEITSGTAGATSPSSAATATASAALNLPILAGVFKDTNMTTSTLSFLPLTSRTLSIAVATALPVDIAESSMLSNWTITATTINNDLKNATVLQPQAVTNTDSASAVASKRVVVSAVSSVASILGVGLLCGFFIYKRKQAANAGNSGIEDKARFANVYGGPPVHLAREKGKLFNIRRLFSHGNAVDVYEPRPVFISSPETLVSTYYEESAINHGGLRAQEARLSRKSHRHSRPSRIINHDECESSMYSTDAELPFKLGSPIQANQPRPESDQESYRIASWRYRNPSDSDIRQGTNSTIRPTIMQSGINHARKSFAAIQSSFSVASVSSSEFGPSMNRPMNFSRPSHGTIREDTGEQVTVPPLVPRSQAVADRYNAGRMVDVSRNSTQNRFDTVGRIPLNTVDDSCDIVPRDGRKTQVYNLLKRALNK